MSFPITGYNTWPATVTAPSTGDAVNQAAWEAGFQDLANRTQYLKDRIGGEAHDAVRAFDGGYAVPRTGLQLVDGVSVAHNDRVGVSDGVNSGIYVVNSGGPWPRAADWPAGMLVDGDYFFVQEGVSYGDQGIKVITDGTPVAGMDPIALDVFTQYPSIMGGDVVGYDFDVRVQKARGDAMGNTFRIEALKVRDISDENLGYTQTVRGNVTTSSTAPSTVMNHTFNWSAGVITLVAQVDVIDFAGVAESHHVRETRSFDGVATPVLIGTQSLLQQPASPTSSVSFVWTTTGVAVTVAAATSTVTRFGGFFQVFEVPHP